MKVCGNTDVGKSRTNNEDDYCLACNANQDWMGIVCDGIGGSMAGEVASHAATITMYEAFHSAPVFEKDYQVHDWIFDNLQAANKKIYSKARFSKKMRGMGTTAVGVIVCKIGTYIFNVGDSRVYAKYEDGFVQMSEDDSYVAQLVREGKLTLQQAKVHPKRNMLTNALGIWPNLQSVEIHKIDPEYSYLLVCSDGLHGYVDEEKMEEIICDAWLPLPEKVQQLLQSANDAGGYDNCTAIVFDHTEVANVSTNS